MTSSLRQAAKRQQPIAPCHRQTYAAYVASKPLPWLSTPLGTRPHFGRGLTPRSSGAPTAGCQARETGFAILRLAGLSSHHWVPLSSNVRPRNPMLTVRKTRIEDAALMRELQQLAFAEEGRQSGTRDIPPLQESVDSIAQHIRQEIALVAEQNGALVGSVRGVKGNHGYVVRALIVHPERQGNGAGSLLLRTLEAAMTKPTRVNLTTNSSMKGNVRFYQKHGYTVQESTEPQPGIVLAHMSKHLAGVA